MDKIFILLVLSLSTCASNGYSLKLFSAYIPGEKQFPEFSIVTVLDDIIVGYYNSIVYIPRGNTTNEDDVIESVYINDIIDYMHYSFKRRSYLLTQNNSYEVYQTLVQCELLNTQPGKMIIKDAAGGFTTDELTYINNNFTYFVNASYSQVLLKPHLEEFKENLKKIFYPTCKRTLENYLKTRADQIRSLKKPNVKFVRKANTASGSFQAICLATGFYPRHINLTLFRDGQPVSDHKITGGDLLPNDDGTYQMKKILKISEEEKKENRKYTCTATHLSLDNKLDVKLTDNLDNDHYLFYIIGAVCVVMLLTFAIILGIWRKWRQGGEYDLAEAEEYSSEDEEL
ncbi:class I histocompatibility antigen, F10 alpha chain-like [Paramisgurnus dabryanus]|uniref:class I histocompatibility antigen, F10 alpha chain-like n=1 Tax=Paramisgurnus dabryanus TaxID=90735 RepID=UPI0031F3EC1E